MKTIKAREVTDDMIGLRFYVEVTVEAIDVGSKYPVSIQCTGDTDRFNDWLGKDVDLIYPNTLHTVQPKVTWNYDMSKCPTDVRCHFRDDAGNEFFGVLDTEYMGSHPPKAMVPIMYDMVGWPIAWASYTSPSEPEQWIEHDGRNWPKCDPRDEVEVLLKDGNIGTSQANDLNWVWEADTSDVLKYRVIKKISNEGQ